MTSTETSPAMPETWTRTRLGQIGTVVGGSGFPPHLQGRREGDFPFFKVSDMNTSGNERELVLANNWITERDLKRLSARAIPAGAVAFAKVGAAVFLERKRKVIVPSCVDNNMSAFVPNPTVFDARFAYHWFCDFPLSSLVSVGTLPSINGGQIKSVEITLPSLAEQRAIADVLDAVDGELGTREQLLAKMRATRSALVSRLMAGGGSESRRHVAFPDVFATVNTRGKAVDSRDYLRSGSTPVIDQGQDFIAGYANAGAPIAAGPDGVIVFGDHTRAVKYVPFDFFAGADGTKVLTVKTDDSTRYLAYAIAERGIPSLGYNRHFRLLKQFEFDLPEPAMQHEVAASIAAFDSLVEEERLALAKARNVKQALLHDLVRGVLKA